ncbi:ATP synthase F1 subunit epsilon [Oscillospiraceae bacterium MB08-C2-2]|nr:ATP synthase F1 subunit epsilon [Oscillospiraceae bacterium MB08-C2-2]
MAERQILLKVLTPNRTVTEQAVDYVILRTTGGDMGVLPGHAPCLVQLDYGILRAFSDKKQVLTLAVLEGFATVSGTELVVLSSVADDPEHIEAAIQSIAQEREENLRHEQTANLEMHRLETALRHSLVSMDISSYSIIKGHEGSGSES